MEIKQIIESYIGKKVVLVSPSKNIPMPLKPLILQGLEEDYFWAADSKNLPFYAHSHMSEHLFSSCLNTSGA